MPRLPNVHSEGANAFLTFDRRIIVHDLLALFPDRHKRHGLFPQLQNLVDSITHHKAMKVKERHVLDNMIRASLIFTVCFKDNLEAALEHLNYVCGARRPFFAVDNQGNLRKLLYQLAEGELTDWIPSHNCHGPHYWLMIDATEQAGLEAVKVERFVGWFGSEPIPDLCRPLGMCEPLIDYLVYSDQCTRSFLSSFATIALRELTLSGNFHQIVNHLPPDKRLQGFRDFLTRHIDLDEGEHGPLMAQALEQVSTKDEDVDRCMMTMINFYDYRKAVYDACLLETPIY